MNDFNEYYDFLAEDVGVPTEALDLAFSLSGCTKETAEAILNYYTGWRSFEGYMKELNGEE